MNIQDIDSLLESAKRRKASNEIELLNKEIQECREEIGSLEDGIKSRGKEKDVFAARKRTYEGKMLELAALTDVIEPDDFSQAKASLDELITEVILQLENFDAHEVKAEEDISLLRTELERLTAERSKYPADPQAAPQLPQPPVIETEEQRLITQIRETGLLKKTAGSALAIFGGEPGRASGQAVSNYLKTMLNLDSVTWFDASGKYSLSQKITSRKINCLVVFTHMSVRIPDVYDLAKACDVKLVMLNSSGKQRALTEVAKAYGITLRVGGVNGA